MCDSTDSAPMESVLDPMISLLTPWILFAYIT